MLTNFKEDEHVAHMEAIQKTYRTMLVRMILPYCKDRNLDSISNNTLCDIMNQVKPLLSADAVTGCIMSYFKKDYFSIPFDEGMDWKGFFNRIAKPDAIDRSALEICIEEFYKNANWASMDRLTTTWVDFSYDFVNVILDLRNPLSHRKLVDACIESFQDGLWKNPPFLIKGSLQASTQSMFRIRLEMECPPIFAFYMVSEVCSVSHLKGHVLFERLMWHDIIDSSFKRAGYKWTVSASVSSSMMYQCVCTNEANALAECMVKAIDDAMHCRGASTEAFQTLHERLLNQLKKAPARYSEFMKQMCLDVGIKESASPTYQSRLQNSHITFLRRSLMRFIMFLESCRSVLVYNSQIICRFKSSRLSEMVRFHEVKGLGDVEQMQYINKRRSRCYQKIRVMLDSLFSMSQKYSLVSILETTERIGRAMDEYNLMLRQETAPRDKWASIDDARTDQLKYVISPYEDSVRVDLAAPIQERNTLLCNLLNEKGSPLASMENAVNKYEMDINMIGDAVMKLSTNVAYTESYFDESAWVLLNSIFKAVHNAQESMEVCEHFIQRAWSTNKPKSQFLFEALLWSITRMEKDLDGAHQRMFTADAITMHNLYPAPEPDFLMYDSDDSQDLSMFECNEDITQDEPSAIQQTGPCPSPVPTAPTVPESERVMFGEPNDSELAKGDSNSQVDPDIESDSGPDFNPKRKAQSKKKRTTTMPSSHVEAADDDTSNTAAASTVHAGKKSRCYGFLSPRAFRARHAPK